MKFGKLWPTFHRTMDTDVDPDPPSKFFFWFPYSFSV